VNEPWGTPTYSDQGDEQEQAEEAMKSCQEQNREVFQITSKGYCPEWTRLFCESIKKHGKMRRR
jgi:hypothetical protein